MPNVRCRICSIFKHPLIYLTRERESTTCLNTVTDWEVLDTSYRTPVYVGWVLFRNSYSAIDRTDLKIKILKDDVNSKNWATFKFRRFYCNPLLFALFTASKIDILP